MKRLELLLFTCILTTFSTRGWAAPRHKVTIDSVPQGAAIYLEAREAGIQGHTPHAFKLKAGKYTFFLEAEGYQPFARTVQVKKGATFTFTLVHRPSPATLTISPAAGSTSAGAVVKVNGKEVGKVPITLSLQAGRYLIEVTKPGFSDFGQWRDIQAGDKGAIQVNLVAKDPGKGTLLVACNIMGAEVYVDGRKVDDAPALVEQVTPGKHVVEVRAKGHLSRQQEVMVMAGATKKVTLELEPDKQTLAASGGTLLILADQKDVEVLVDGQTRGKAPIKVEGLVEGSHLVEGRKPGMVSADQEVMVKKGTFKTIKLVIKEPTVSPRTGALRVISPVLGALVFIDGALVGKTPLLRHQLPVGPHFVTVRHEGHEELVQTVEVKSGQISEIKAELTKIEAASSQPAGASSQPATADLAPVETIGLSSYGGHLVPPSAFTGDISLGFPHIVEGRLTAGLLDRGAIGLDGGVEFHSYGAMSEIGLHTKLRVLRKSAFSTAFLFAFGGGGGPSSRNTVYANLGAVGSMWFKRLVTFSARAYFNFYSDRHCPEKVESSELDVCRDPELGKDMRDRDSGTRFLLSAVLEIPVHRRINVFGLLEGAPFQGNRNAYSDSFAGIMPESDPALYGRAGVTFKY